MVHTNVINQAAGHFPVTVVKMAVVYKEKGKIEAVRASCDCYC